jgi:cytochrome c551/c552
MRRTIALATALALASASLPAFAGAPQKKYVPSYDDLIAAYAAQIAALPATTITTALALLAAPSTSFNAAGATTTIEAAVGTAAFVPTVITEVNAAIAAHQAAVGPGYVTVSQSFYDAALAAKLAKKTP